MAHVKADRVQQTTQSTGTGSLVLDGPVPARMRPFESVMNNGDTCWILIEHQTSAEWEICLGTYNAGTISRSFPAGSASVTGGVVPFSAGTKTVSLLPPAGRMLVMDENRNARAGNVVCGQEGTTDAGTFGFTNANGPSLTMWGSGTAGAGKIEFRYSGGTVATLTAEGLRAPNFLIKSQESTDAGTVGFINGVGPSWQFNGVDSPGVGELIATISGGGKFYINDGGAFASDAAFLGFVGRTKISAPADGVLAFFDSAGTSFSRLQFGGTTSSYPALRRSGAALETVLADNSAFTPIGTASLLAKSGSHWAVDTTAQSQTIGPLGIYNFPAGGGLVVLTEDTTGQSGLFLVGGGVVILVAQTAAIFAAGSPPGGKIGLEYVAGNFKVTNNTGSTYIVGIGGVRVRAAS